MIYLHLPIVALLSLAFVVTAQEQFTEIDDVPQDVISMMLRLNCPKGGRAPKTMFTLAPSSDSTVSIWTYPADLVTVNVDKDEEMTFAWNNDAVENSEEKGGVRIYVPFDQLKAVSAADSVETQILDGFTNIEYLSISSSSRLYATFTKLSGQDLTLKASSSSQGAIISNVPLQTLSLSSSAKLEIEAPRIQSLSISSSAKLTMKGNVESGSLSSSSKMLVDGALTGSFSVSSSASLQVANVTGSISASSSAKITTSSTCDSVDTSSSARCKVISNLDKVTVQVDEQPMVSTGNSLCNSWLWWSSAGFIYIGIFVPITILILAIVFYFYCCKKRKTDKDKHGYPPAQQHQVQVKSIRVSKSITPVDPIAVPVKSAQLAPVTTGVSDLLIDEGKTTNLSNIV